MRWSTQISLASPTLQKLERRAIQASEWVPMLGGSTRTQLPLGATAVPRLRRSLRGTAVTRVMPITGITRAGQARLPE
jgi:hypothetical protein